MWHAWEESYVLDFGGKNWERPFGRPRRRRDYNIKINFKYNWRVWTRAITVRNLRVL
jgi:hypothetical protein